MRCLGVYNRNIACRRLTLGAAADGLYLRVVVGGVAVGLARRPRCRAARLAPLYLSLLALALALLARVARLRGLRRRLLTRNNTSIALTTKGIHITRL